MSNIKINETTVYKTGNPWQKKIYQKMADFLQAIPEVKSFGHSSRGNKYKHLLTIEQSHYNFITPEIYDATKERFSNHKAGDLNRVLTNTAASQNYCFNLIIYLQQHLYLADELFSKLLDKPVKVQHIEPEFTPNLCDTVVAFQRTGDESIGDQDLQFGIGTDADIAIFYTYNNDKKGVILIEFKYIEAEFSVCSSFARNRTIKYVCSGPHFFSNMVASSESLCGYKKYFNWNLTVKSTVFDIEKIKSSNACPFRFGLNQLWRNMLLAEQVATARNCDEFGFWVFSPSENFNYLWRKGKTEKLLREILTKRGNENFRNIALETVLDKLQTIVTIEADSKWLLKLSNKYRIY